MPELTQTNSDLIRLLDDAGLAVIFVDHTMRIQRLTVHAAQLPNLAGCEVGRPLNQVFANLPGCDALLKAAQAVLDRQLSQDAPVQCTANTWMEARIRPWHRGQAETPGAVITLMDTTALKQMEQALREASERYRTLVDYSLDAINILRDGKFIYVNPSAVKMYGATSAQDLLGQPSRDRVHPDDLPLAHGRMSRVLEHQLDAPLVEMRFLTLDGTTIDVQAQATRIEFEGAPAIHVAWRDVTELKRSALLRKESEERMQVADQVLHLAFHDALTNLPNRRVLTERVNQTRMASKRSGCHAALMVIDLDNFKSLNDTHGHPVGDLLLIEVAQRLKQCVRETDTVVRFGGDEFVVLLANLTPDPTESAALALIVAGKVLSLLAQPYQFDQYGDDANVISIEHLCTASIGVAVFLHDTASHEDLLRRADAAMFEAKKAGKSLVRIHQTSA
jgi:diguanylate cyclase (GGDEF)-like protein/PAS domain S-box-containing protein